MAQYTCVEDALKRLEWLENCRELTAPAEERITTLKMYLRLLKTFLVSATKLSTADTDLNGLLTYVEDQVKKTGKEVQSLCVNAEDESMNDTLKNLVSGLDGEIKDLTPRITTFYMFASQLDGTVSDRPLVELVNSLLDNLKDLLHYKMDLIDSIRKQIVSLEVKFQFLKNFVWFSSERCIEHEKLRDFLMLVKSVAGMAACLSFRCVFEVNTTVDLDAMMRTNFSQVLWTIELIEPEMRDSYISALKVSLSSRLESTSPMLNEVAMGFLLCFLNDVEELLSQKSIFQASAEHQLQNLREELKFLIAFLMDPPKQDKKDKILGHIEALVRQTAPVIHMLLIRSRDDDASDIDLFPLFDLLNKIDVIKEEMEQAYRDLWMLIRSNFPNFIASELLLIDFVLQTLEKVLKHQTDSIAYVRHQLDIVQVELICLRSLLRNEALKMDVTVLVHEAKHAIGSLTIQQSPLWHCMLQLSAAIRKIRTVNNTLAIDYFSQTVEIGGATENSRYLQSEMEVGLTDKVIEAAILKKKISSGSKRLTVISVVSESKDYLDTLVKEVYNDGSINSQFEVRKWFYIPEVYKGRELLINILKPIIHNNKSTTSIYRLSEKALGREVKERLKEAKYLIVLDDIWDTGAWDDISEYFPDNDNGNRILLIS